MILKFLIADAAGGTCHIVHAPGSDQAAGECRPRGVVPASSLMLDEVVRVEYGGPLEAEVRDLSLTVSLILESVWARVPSDPDGWAEAIDATGRGEYALDQDGHSGHVWWVKAYPPTDENNECRPTVVLHDCRAFLCDHQGQTLEKLGPS